VSVQTTSASEEMEQSLRLERTNAELQIARYRVWFFGFIFVNQPILALVAHLQHRPHPNIAPIIMFGGTFVLALVFRHYVRRMGPSTGLVYASIVLDLATLAAPGFVFPRTDPSTIAQIREISRSFVPAGMLCVLLLNVLRMDVRAALFGGLIAIPIFLGIALPLYGPEPAVIGVTITFPFVALLGAVAARRYTKVLDTFLRFQLLRRYLPARAVERVMSENPEAALALGGRLSTVTLIAADLRGFTRLSEKLPPDEVVAQLNAFHGRMVEQIDKHGGALDKFIGDGLLAVFGMADADAKDAGAAAAVACARGMLDALAELNTARAAAGQEKLAMGVAVHTGPVVAGNIGAPGRRLEFTVIGDTVNTVARLEGLTKEAGRPLLVSSATVERLPSPATLEQLPPMPIRGRDEPIRAYAILAG
jgi:class 3 adenylate cyclase